MTSDGIKYLGKSETYKNVYKYRYYQRANRIFYYGQLMVNGQKQKKSGFTNERDAAKWVDLQLIRAGKEPRNVLKRKL